MVKRRHSPSVVTAMVALLAAPLASALVVFAQPSAERGTRVVEATRAPRPAVINHIVLITLRDASDAEALIADSDRLLANIPSVVSYFCGTHLDTGRSTVDGSYHVGLYVGFDSAEGYMAYIDHEGHVELVKSWAPRVESMRIFDVVDPTP